MPRIHQLFAEAVDHIETYIHATVQLQKLRALKAASKMVSDWLTFTLLLWVMSMVLLFASIGLSLWWGALLGNTYYGFFAIAGCYLLLLVAVRYLLSPHLKKVIIQRMLKYLQP